MQRFTKDIIQELLTQNESELFGALLSGEASKTNMEADIRTSVVVPFQDGLNVKVTWKRLNYNRATKQGTLTFCIDVPTRSKE